MPAPISEANRPLQTRIPCRGELPHACYQHGDDGNTAGIQEAVAAGRSLRFVPECISQPPALSKTAYGSSSQAVVRSNASAGIARERRFSWYPDGSVPGQ